MTPRLVAATLAAATVLAGACSDDRGLPDLDAVTDEDLPVDARVTLGPAGCEPDRVSIRAGAWVEWTATADDVSLRRGDDEDLGPDTGLLLDGEQVEWRFRDAGEVTVTCVGPGGDESSLVIEVREPTERS